MDGKCIVVRTICELSTESYVEYRSVVSFDVRMTESNVCKVVLLGETGSGKSCLIARYMHGAFDNTMGTTIGAAFGSRKLWSESRKCYIMLNIWDTAGDEKYRSLVHLYYRGAKAAIICCDLTNLSSFNAMDYWWGKLHQFDDKCEIYICGTKLDLIDDGLKHRAITDKDFKMLHFPVFETSSKTGKNISELFQTIADDFCASKILPSMLSSRIKISEQNAQPIKCCYRQ